MRIVRKTFKTLKKCSNILLENTSNKKIKVYKHELLNTLILILILFIIITKALYHLSIKVMNPHTVTRAVLNCTFE